MSAAPPLAACALCASAPAHAAPRREARPTCAGQAQDTKLTEAPEQRVLGLPCPAASRTCSTAASRAGHASGPALSELQTCAADGARAASPDYGHCRSPATTNYRPQATPSRPGARYRTGRPEQRAAGPRANWDYGHLTATGRANSHRPRGDAQCAENGQRLCPPHRPKTREIRESRVAALPYLVSSRLVSSRLVSCHPTVRPYNPRALSSSVPSSSTQECYSHQLLAPMPEPRSILVSSRLAPSRHIFSALCSLISSRSKPRLPDRAAVGRCSREQPPLPLAGSYRSSPRDRSALPAAPAGLLHCGGGSLRPRVRAEVQRLRTN